MAFFSDEVVQSERIGESVRVMSGIAEAFYQDAIKYQFMVDEAEKRLNQPIKNWFNCLSQEEKNKFFWDIDPYDGCFNEFQMPPYWEIAASLLNCPAIPEIAREIFDNMDNWRHVIENKNELIVSIQGFLDDKGYYNHLVIAEDISNYLKNVLMNNSVDEDEVIF